MAKMIQLSAALVLLALATSVVADEVDPNVEQQYQSIVSKLKDLTNSASNELLLKATKMYKPLSKSDGSYTPEEALALNIWRVYRDSKDVAPISLRGNKKFDRIYEQSVTKLCADHKKLNDEFESFMSQHKNIDDWRHRNASSPVFWSATVALCETQSANGAMKNVYKQFKIYKKKKTV